MTPQIETIKASLKMALQVVNSYEWLLDLYVLEFYIDNHWEKLPIKWRECFKDMDPQQLGHILLGKTTNIVLPLSFLALMKSINALSLPRESVPTKFINKNQSEFANHPKLRNLFLKHVKLKKRHEISLMADVVKKMSEESDCRAVIDFGSGLGHLVRVLSYQHDLSTAGIECQSQLTDDARKLDSELEYTARKHLSDQDISKLKQPTHINMTLTSETQLDDMSLPSSMDSYGLIGLHPCGDLGPLLLRHFVSSNRVKFICVVGCCYMKLSCEGKLTGYPMSDFVSSISNKLSYVSREIACHAIEMYTERLVKGKYEDLKIHSYRAALERILVEHDPKLKHSHVRSIKHSDTMSFHKYCSIAVDRLDVPALVTEASWARAEAELARWPQVVLLYTLRLALAPLVETVILLDRVLYVLERGYSCEIHPVFDPRLSPRNHVIIAKKL